MPPKPSQHEQHRRHVYGVCLWVLTYLWAFACFSFEELSQMPKPHEYVCHHASCIPTSSCSVPAPVKKTWQGSAATLLRACTRPTHTCRKRQAGEQFPGSGFRRDTLNPGVAILVHMRPSLNHTKRCPGCGSRKAAAAAEDSRAVKPCLFAGHSCSSSSTMHMHHAPNSQLPHNALPASTKITLPSIHCTEQPATTTAAAACVMQLPASPTTQGPTGRLPPPACLHHHHHHHPAHTKPHSSSQELTEQRVRRRCCRRR